MLGNVAEWRLVGLALGALSGAALAQAAALQPLAPFFLPAAGGLAASTATATSSTSASLVEPPAAPWAVVGLPGQQSPATRYRVLPLDGRPVLQVEAQGSYGNLVHPLSGQGAGVMRWRWRVDQPLSAVDLRTKAGDDAALKVCAMFDLPRERVPFVERQLLRLAEARFGQPLPNATLCYVWDPSWPRGTVVPNAYTRRVRFITLDGAAGRWWLEQHDLRADFLRAFGDESAVVPTLNAVAVGADADNTGGHSLAWIEDLRLLPLEAPR